MANKYRMPFIFDGRAEAATAAGSDSADTLLIYDSDTGDTKTISVSELTTLVGGGGGSSWIPAPEAIANATVAGGITLPASPDGLHFHYALTDIAAGVNALAIDFDTLSDGEWVFLSFTGGGEAANWSLEITPSGTRTIGEWVTTGGSVDQFTLGGAPISDGSTVFGAFKRSGGNILGLFGGGMLLNQAFGP